MFILIERVLLIENGTGARTLRTGCQSHPSCKFCKFRLMRVDVPIIRRAYSTLPSGHHNTVLRNDHPSEEEEEQEEAFTNFQTVGHRYKACIIR